MFPENTHFEKRAGKKFCKIVENGLGKHTCDGAKFDRGNDGQENGIRPDRPGAFTRIGASFKCDELNRFYSLLSIVPCRYSRKRVFRNVSPRYTSIFFFFTLADIKSRTLFSRILFLRLYCSTPAESATSIFPLLYLTTIYHHLLDTSLRILSNNRHPLLISPFLLLFHPSSRHCSSPLDEMSKHRRNPLSLVRPAMSASLVKFHLHARSCRVALFISPWFEHR